jgi:phage baseplate assembly protein gpV
MSGDLENLILTVIERWVAGRYSERHGIVTSYDPKHYLAKVTFQPEGQESGWLPIETGHIGQGYGIVIGLQPGQGGVSAAGVGGQAGSQSSNQGDQVIVRFQEGDFESGKIVQRVHSDQDTPPQAQSGEIIIWTKFQQSGGGTPDSGQGGQGGTGQQIALKKDGSITVTDGNGATIKLDGQGNIKITGKLVQIDAQTFTAVASGDAGIKGNGNVVVKAGGKLGIEAGSEAVWNEGTGDVSDGSVTPPGSAPSVPPFQTP